MKIKVSEATPKQLNWLVLKAQGQDFTYFNLHYLDAYPYSTDWSQGGPIIDREHICLDYWDIPPTPAHWTAGIAGTMDSLEGSTPLVAAMRCFVFSRLGDEVEVPDDLH
jgi:hypothetical protein